MSSAARNSYVLGVCLALVSALVLVRGFGDGPSGHAASSGAGTGGADLAEASVSFTISGNARGPISPGVRVPVNLEITNPHRARLVVTDLGMAVRKVSAPRATEARPCTVRDFAVDQIVGNRTIRLDGRTTRTLRGLQLRRATWPRVGMLNRAVNQDGCKGASLTLAYTGSGSLAAHR